MTTPPGSQTHNPGGGQLKMNVESSPIAEAVNALEWQDVVEGEPLPGNVMAAVLVGPRGESQVWVKTSPEWPPVIGWKKWFPLSPLGIPANLR